MRNNFDLGMLALFVLVVGAFLFAVITIAWRVKPRKTVSLGMQTSGGATHIIPGEGHVEAEDCCCRPAVYGLHGSLFIEHRDLAGRR